MNTVEICEWVKNVTGRELDPDLTCPVSGGCINDAWLLSGEEGPVFLKSNRAERIDLFVAEKRSLEMLRSSRSIRVPEPFAHGVVSDLAVFAMEGISLSSSAGPGSQAALGRALAALHQTHSPDGRFGADFDNHIGATEQCNSRHSSWADFFVENRLRFQIQLAAENGRNFPESEEMLRLAHLILSDSNPEPSLLHGDLWSGNVGFDENGMPVLYDPASYFGDGETDIAFSKMFGGFGSEFYRSYRELRPAPAREDLLHEIYNLYHILNHYNLFGGSYGEQAGRVIARVLSGA